MKLCSFSINQALGVWSELWQAYYGDNGFGGDTAEIYAFRLLEHSPVLCLRPAPAAPDDYLDASAYESGREARGNLCLLLRTFEEQANCSIEVDGMSIANWDSGLPFYHRCHVRVLRREH